MSVHALNIREATQSIDHSKKEPPSFSETWENIKKSATIITSSDLCDDASLMKKGAEKVAKLYFAFADLQETIAVSYNLRNKFFPFFGKSIRVIKFAVFSEALSSIGTILSVGEVASVFTKVFYTKGKERVLCVLTLFVKVGEFLDGIIKIQGFLKLTQFIENVLPWTTMIKTTSVAFCSFQLILIGKKIVDNRSYAKEHFAVEIKTLEDFKKFTAASKTKEAFASLGISEGRFVRRLERMEKIAKRAFEQSEKQGVDFSMKVVRALQKQTKCVERINGSTAISHAFGITSFALLTFTPLAIVGFSLSAVSSSIAVGGLIMKYRAKKSFHRELKALIEQNPQKPRNKSSRRKRAVSRCPSTDPSVLASV